MKFGVFSVSMPEYGIEESVRLLKELGYDGVESVSYTHLCGPFARLCAEQTPAEACRGALLRRL